MSFLVKLDFNWSDDLLVCGQMQHVEVSTHKARYNSAQIYETSESQKYLSPYENICIAL